MSTAELSIYHGRRIFLTGHTGFKGGWFAAWLKCLGARVHGYGLAPNTNPCLFQALGLEERIESTVGNINDMESLSAVINRFEPEMVFHFAAQPLVRYAYQQPLETFETNVIGTAKLLEAVRQCSSVKSCVVITSDKCYQNNEWAYAYRENDPLGGHDPYSASKGAAELVVSSYRSSFFEPSSQGRTCGVASARAGNVIGGGDWAPDRIVPDCVRAIQRGDPLMVRNPRAIRPWQHVLEPLYGYLLLGAALFQNPKAYSSAWNFGPDRSDLDVGGLVDLVMRMWGSGSWQDGTDRRTVHEAHSRLNVKESVSLAVSWYKSYYEGRDMWKYSIGQITDYSNMGQCK
jgi:CDP-glucose 4,6-dehydratase